MSYMFLPLAFTVWTACTYAAWNIVFPQPLIVFTTEIPIYWRQHRMKLMVVSAGGLILSEMTKLKDRDKCTLGHFSRFRVGFLSWKEKLGASENQNLCAHSLKSQILIWLRLVLTRNLLILEYQWGSTHLSFGKFCSYY